MTLKVLFFLAALNGATPSGQVSDALRAGIEADMRNDGAALLSAATRLEKLGAHPVDGEPDLAAEWKAKAISLGAAPDAPVWRGRVLGPAYRQGTLAANSRFETRQSFIAGQKADISVEAENGALELSVRDDDGSVVCQVAASLRTAGCLWVPPFTGPNTIAITNSHSRQVRYVLVTN